MDTLNLGGDESPYDENITWTCIGGRTPIYLMDLIRHLSSDIPLINYAKWEKEKNALISHLLYQFLLWLDVGTDFVVSPSSTPLDGANNIVWNFATHATFVYPTPDLQNKIIDMLIDV